MAAYTPLKAITFLATEIAAVEAAVGYEDATGVLSTVVDELAETIAKLNRLATYVPAGSNLTAINNAITAIS